MKVSFGMGVERGGSVAPERAVGQKYRLVRSLGRGASGQVYEAEHIDLGRRYALKVLHRSLESQRPTQRFSREPRVLARLEHENIVGLIDVGSDADVGDYLVLELIRGSTLRSALHALRLEGTERTLVVAKQIARGLGHAHAMGVVHRDLKPENVMLSSHADGRPLVKILDFGIARLFDTADFLTMSGATLGTAAYMAPEQARGERDLDHRVDVYALGVIVYEALSGVRPFEGASYNETLFHVLTRKHVPLAERCPGLQPAICEAVERALQKDRADRFVTAEAFAAALGVAEQPSSMRPALDELATHDSESEDRTIARASSSSEPVPATASRGRSGGRRSVVYGLLAGAVGFALGWVYRADDASHPGPAKDASAAGQAPRQPPSPSEADRPREPSPVGSDASRLEPRPAGHLDSEMAGTSSGVTSGASSAPPRKVRPVIAPSAGVNGGIPKDRGF